jgi:hypothetical protein
MRTEKIIKGRDWESTWVVLYSILVALLIMWWAHVPQL